jgi:hypothetical protein
MTNKDAIRRHLSVIKDQLDSAEYELDTEVVGDDARHLLDDIKAAQRVLASIDPDAIRSANDMDAFKIRIDRVCVSIRVIRGSLDRLETNIRKVCDHLQDVRFSAEESRPDDDDESI